MLHLSAPNKTKTGMVSWIFVIASAIVVLVVVFHVASLFCYGPRQAAQMPHLLCFEFYQENLNLRDDFFNKQ